MGTIMHLDIMVLPEVKSGPSRLIARCHTLRYTCLSKYNYNCYGTSRFFSFYWINTSIFMIRFFLCNIICYGWLVPVCINRSVFVDFWQVLKIHITVFWLLASRASVSLPTFWRLTIFVVLLYVFCLIRLKYWAHFDRYYIFCFEAAMPSYSSWELVLFFIIVITLSSPLRQLSCCLTQLKHIAGKYVILII